MSLSKPYEPINPNYALSEFVFTELQKRGVKVERINELLKVQIAEKDKNLFAVPNSGEYILRFSNKQISSEIQMKLSNYRNIHITNHHPLIKTLEKKLNYLPVQFAEFQFENRMIIKEWCKWFLPSFQKIDMKINFQDEKIPEKQLVASEIWYEIKSNAGRGIFPVILKKNPDLQSKDIWYWDENFQKSHRRRRGGLESIDEKIELKDIDLDQAIQKTFTVIKQKFSYNKLQDGAYLRRLRQLRMQQMVLSKFENDNESKELIAHHIRKVNEFKKDVMEESEISVNSVVLLYACQKYIGRIQFINSKNSKQTFFIKLHWDSDSPNMAQIIYPSLGLSQKIKISSDKPVQQSPAFIICPNCKQVNLKQNKKRVEIGEGFCCTKCVIRCSTCNRTMSSGKSQVYWKDEDILLCPDHGVQCAVSQKIIKLEESVHLVNEDYCLKQYAEECVKCKVINKQSIQSNHLWHHLKEDLNPYFLKPTTFLCKKHIVICEETGNILTKKDIVVISSGQTVWKEIVGSCSLCDEKNPFHLKKDLKFHSFQKNMTLCQNHRAICEISQKVVRPDEIITINSGRKVAVQLTHVCYSCKKNNSEYPYFLNEELLQHAYKTGVKLCEIHSHKCEISNNIVTREEIVEINTGKKVAVQLTHVCDSCKKLNLPIVHHLIPLLKPYALEKSAYLCKDHQVICDVSKKIVSKDDVSIISSGKTVLIRYAHTCKSCQMIGNDSTQKNVNPYYLKSEMSVFNYDKEIRGCKKHSFYCWSCEFIRPSYESRGDKSILKMCYECWEKYARSVELNCIIHKKFSTSPDIKGNRLITCPNCNQPLYVICSKKNLPFPNWQQYIDKKFWLFKIRNAVDFPYSFSKKILRYLKFAPKIVISSRHSANRIIPNILIIYNKHSWIIFNKEGIPFASNISGVLNKPIESYHSYYFGEQDD